MALSVSRIHILFVRFLDQSYDFLFKHVPTVMKEVNAEIVRTQGCAIGHLLYHCFHLLHGYGLHEQLVVFNVYQRGDVLSNLIDSILEGWVRFHEELTEMSG